MKLTEKPSIGVVVSIVEHFSVRKLYVDERKVVNENSETRSSLKQLLHNYPFYAVLTIASKLIPDAVFHFDKPWSKYSACSNMPSKLRTFATFQVPTA